MRVRFVIRKARVNQAGVCPLNCRITINGVKTNEFSAGFSVDPKKWDSKAQKIKGSPDYNRRLDLMRSELEEIYLSARSRGVTFSAEEVKDIFTGKKDLTCSVSKLGELYIKELIAKDTSLVTTKRYARFYKYLLAYLKKDMPIELIDRRHVSGFYVHLREKGYDNDYCNKIIQSCIGLFKFAIREGYRDRSPFDAVSLSWKKEEPKKVFLTKAEVELLKTHEFRPKLQRVADSFLFMCFTGLHIGDYRATEESNVYTHSEKEFMKVRRQKTGVEAKFRLHSYAKGILKKYGGMAQLPKISGQKSNDYLKIIAETVGIEKNLTNKVARKTFTDMVINEYRMPMDTVAVMLGHTSTKQLKHYGSINEERIMEEWGEK